jgi:hypothetical protein
LKSDAFSKFKIRTVKMQETVLVKMLVEDLSAKFLKRFDSRMLAIWQESISRSVKDDRIDDALKSYCFGHSKYFLVQSLFLDVGRECGYESKVVPCDQNKYPIPEVTIGRFAFTAHFTFNPHEKYAFNSSLTRKQHSAINNKYMNRGQGSLFGDTFDDSKIRIAEKIQANLLFGCGGNGLDYERNKFLRIAIPSMETAKDRFGKDTNKVFFVENHSFDDILQLVSDKERQQQIKPTIIDVAVPKIKIK